MREGVGCQATREASKETRKVGFVKEAASVICMFCHCWRNFSKPSSIQKNPNGLGSELSNPSSNGEGSDPVWDSVG